LLFALAALLLVPANGPDYNRFWQALMVPPDDLMMKPVVSAMESTSIGFHDLKQLALATTPSITLVRGAIAPQVIPYIERRIGLSVAGPLDTAIANALSSRPTIDSKNPTLTHDPLAADPSAWTALTGSPPEFVTGLKDFRASSTALQNPPGQSSQVFTTDLIPIDPMQKYRIEFSLGQFVSTNATAYLAVAWYDEGGRLLESGIPAPAGAGNPVGWANGTYSYFGLIGETAPTTWTTYRKSFGLGEAAAIPSNAKFVRVGALLNYNVAPAATIQLTNVRLCRKSASEMVPDGAFSSDEHIFVIAPATQMVWTYASQAGRASHHWPANEVATNLAGAKELLAAAHLAGAKPMDLDGIVFELDEYTKPSAANQ